MHFSRCLNVSRDGEKVMSEGKSFHKHASATGKAQHPTVESLMGRNGQIIGGRRPKSLMILDVSGAHEVPKVLHSIIMQRPIRLHVNFEHDPFRRS